MSIKALPDESKALLILLASAFLFSLMGTFMKLSSRDIPSTQLIFYRATFQGMLVLIGMMFIVDDGGTGSRTTTTNVTTTTTRTRLIQHPLGRSHHRSVVLARGIVGGFAFLNYFYALKVLPMGDAVTLFSLYPIITVFSARIFLGEEILWSHLLAALCSLLGAFLIAGPNLLNTSNSVGGSGNGIGSDDNGDNRLGYIAAIVGSFGGSAVLVLTRHAGIAVHTFQLVFSWAIFSIFFSFSFGHSPIGIGIEEPWHMPSSSETWKYISAMVVFGSMAHFMMNYAARLAPAGLGAIVRSSDIMWAYLWQVVIFDQVPTANTVVGVVLVSMSLVLIAVTKMRKEVKVLGTSYSENTNAMMGDKIGAVDELTPILGRSGTLSGGDGVA